jgi:predicted Zn finger-like uncharacterized protein
MKIVCDACQAKYSIADEKVQGKAFKIRCKKCNHIIVVRSSGERAVGAAAEPKPAAAEAQGTWYVVVEGEQMGPLAETDIAARLRRGEITGESLVWKEGLADWVKLSSVPELAQMPSSQATPGVQSTSAPAAEPAPARRSSAAMRAHGSSREAAMAAAPGEDIFSKPAPAASASADLFASPAVAHSSAAAEMPATALPAFAFGAAAAPAPEPAARAPGNGAGESHMTGQRNENSVLFSLANLEALAVPSSSTSARAPSTTSTTEGSGLIDIRSMAARTIGESGRDDAFGGSDALPTFSTPQFSPVAPVFLPMASSGPPKWVYPVLGVLALGIVALGLGIYKVVSVPPPPPPAPAQIVVPALVTQPAPGPAAAPSPGAPAAAQPAKPATPEEKPGEEKAATEKKRPSGKGGKSVAKAQPEAASSAKGVQSTPEPAVAAPAPSKPKKGGSIDDLLDQVNTNRRGGEEPKPKKVATAAVLPSLSQSDIVSAMKAVQPRVKECFNQYKVAGIANVSISVAKGGRIASATVTPGKFAGTPSAACVEAAAKTAKFPPCEAMSFPWPFQLH